MIRIISGTYAGRALRQPATSATRPMTQKVRGALFDRLGELDELRFLDAYAGSGAVGLEALSRGAEQVTFIEQSRTVARVIEENIRLVDAADSCELRAQAVQTAAKSLPPSSFNVIVADPPYATIDAAELDALAELLAPKGLLVVSRASRMATPALQWASLIDERHYGDSTLSFYRRT